MARFKIRQIWFLCGALAAGAQTHWQAQGSGVTVRLNTVSCPAAGTCYAGGDSGTVLKTTNGGQVWTRQVLGTNRPVGGISCANADTCTLAADSLRKTTDGGAHWRSVAGGPVNPITVSCLQTGVCGALAPAYSYWITQNGTTWTQVKLFATLQILSGLQVMSPGTAYATSIRVMPGFPCQGNCPSLPTTYAPEVLKSADSGKTWNVVHSLVSSTTSNDAVLHFRSLNDGYLLHSHGEAYITSNGTTFDPLVSTQGGGHALHFVTSKFGYAVGAGGLILETTNGGISWMGQLRGTASLNAVAFTDSITGYAVGDEGRILKRSSETVSLAPRRALQTSGAGFRAATDLTHFTLPDGRMFNLLGRRPGSK